MKLITDVSKGGEGENAVSAYCAHGQKTLYIIPVAKVRMQYQPTVPMDDDDDELMLNVLRCHLTY